MNCVVAGRVKLAACCFILALATSAHATYNAFAYHLSLDNQAIDIGTDKQARSYFAALRYDAR